MKDVDKLLKKAKTLLGKIVIALFPDNEDGFLDCLGVLPEKYMHKNPDGTCGYDFLSALADTAKDDWKDYDDSVEIPYTDLDINLKNGSEDTKKVEEPWKYPFWNSLSRSDKQEILSDLGIQPEAMEELIQYTAEHPEHKNGKSRNLFGWG